MLGICFELKSSKRLAVILVLLHALVIFSIFSLPVWTAPSQSLLTLIVLLNLVYLLNRYALLRTKDAWQTFTLMQDSVQIQCRSGKQWSGKILPNSVCTAALIILAVKPEAHFFVQYQVVLGDALPNDLFRVLSVQLRFMPQSAALGNKQSSATF